jgi:glycosyl hydrolase family 20
MSNIPAVVPKPRRMRLTKGTFDARKAQWRVSPAALKHKAIRHKLDTLGLDFAQDRSLPEWTIATAKMDATLAEAPERSEGYALVIKPDGAVLCGHDDDGLFWSLMTLEQMLEQAKRLPCVLIADWPEVALRGHHDDISRKQVSKVEDFKRIIHLLSRYKFNCYTPYMEDTLHLRSFPDVGEGRGKLMPDEVREIVREGELHNVDVIPTFSLIGHQENLLALPRYRHLGREVFQPPSSYDPDKPAVRKFLKKVIADVCRLFPSKYFHMCFDETQGVTERQFFAHANFCAKELVKHGKTPVMWVDMIYNHFGVETVKKLHPSIIPVDWQYGDVSKGVKHWKELAAQGRETWGLAGYGNCGNFLPDFPRAKKHYADWVRQLRKIPGGALFSSIWGDNGYENSRDLSWNLYAAFGENTWSGAAADDESFERRFQTTFYGRALPKLEKLIRELPGSLGLSPREWWGLHRKRACSLLRYAADQRDKAKSAKADVKKLSAALKAIDACRPLARREADHLDHFEVALRRMLSVANRLDFAKRYISGMPKAKAKAEVKKLVAEMREAKALYRRVWLRHNKRENIDVSLRVFDEVAESFLELPSAPPKPRLGCFSPIDLSEHYNFNHIGIGGIPIGAATVNGVPFEFADLQHTHVRVAGRGASLSLPVPSNKPLRDVHFVVAAQKPASGKPAPAATLEWLHEKHVVYSETLLSITHLCDWWAILGEHIWAGGGFKYTDPSRVQLAMVPDPMYGLTHLSNTPNVGTPHIDEVRLTCLTDDEIRLFAATAELLT